MFNRATSGTPSRLLRTPMLAAGCAALLSLAGCSGSDSGVELNGKIFDAVGMSGGSKSRSEPKLAERAPLVPPPKVAALPVPDSGQGTSGHMAWPNDPDRQRSAAAANSKQALDKKCKDPMIGRPEHERSERDAQCRAEQGSLLSSVTGWLPGSKPAGEAAATTAEEGDPGAGIVTGSTKPAATQKAGASAKTR
jgi:hypothetical protein